MRGESFMKIPAYAKINLYLDVFAPRADGFHGIKSVMHSISLCDMISCEKTDEAHSVTLTCDDPTLSVGEDNLVYRAARLFLEHYGIEDGVAFHIEKRIPVAAGLAGGSTDAAAALILLNEIFAIGASTYELCLLGARLGSDVPFCIVGGTCAAFGRGEELDILTTPLKLDLVVAKAGEGISTPAAYRSLDERFGASLDCDFGNFDTLAAAVCAGDALLLAQNLYNTFESVVLDSHKEAAEAKKFMLDSDGCMAALLSGSGPSVFGIYSDSDSARRAADELSRRGYAAFACTSAPTKI